MGFDIPLLKDIYMSMPADASRRDGIGMNHPGYGFRRPREFPAYPGTPFTSFTVLSAGATEVTPLVPGVRIWW